MPGPTMSEPPDRSPDERPLLTLPVRRGEDVVLARQRAREVAELTGFEPHDRTRIATAVSEIARTALQNAGGGEIAFALRPGGGPGGGRPALAATVRETGPGRDDLRALLDGRTAGTGGLGPIAARRLMDGFAVEREGHGDGDGAVVLMTKVLPRGAAPLTADRLARIAAELAREIPADPVEELQRQNRELLDALAELRERQADLKRLNGELEQLNHELEETNRGVVALYAELDEKAISLRRASDLKSRFLSHMSHEFRSPLNSILSLVRILLDRGDGPLNPEQEMQVGYIRQSADGLLTLVNDLLDLAKVEAGRQTIRTERFEIDDLFGTLRGMFRPLLPDSPDGGVALVFDPAPSLPSLHTDQGKLAQILRNFLSNALKFTERGEIRVSARMDDGDTREPGGETGARVTFTVADTGAGIPAEDLDRIFEEFAQVDSPTQRRVRGTGLGLPLSRGLAELLGGSIVVRSAPGEGSAFSLTVPCVLPGLDGPGPDGDGPDGDGPDGAAGDEPAGDEPTAGEPTGAAESPPSAPPPARVLVIEDDPATRYLYEKHLEGSGFEAVGAGTVAEARAALREFHPAAVLLDIVLEADSGWALLEELKREVATRHIPVLVLTVVDDRERAFTLGADDFCLKPIERAWLLERLDALAGRTQSGADGSGADGSGADGPAAGGSGGPPRGTALVIDDEPPARYLLRSLLEEAGWRVVEAERGGAGLTLARRSPPDVIFLDLVMPDLTGFQVLDRLGGDDRTAGVPVVICSSRLLTAADRRRLADSSAVLLAKDPVSREAALARLGEALERAGLTHGTAGGR